MKQISIVAAIVLLLVAVTFFMRDKNARAEWEKSGRQVAGLSNEVSRLNTIIVMHGSTNSELKQHLAKVLDRSTGFSNRLAKTSDELKQAHQQHQTLQATLQQEAQKAADAEVRIAELQTEARTLREMIQGRDAEVARLKASLADAETERVASRTRLQKAEADVVRLQLDMTDEVALRAQLDRLKKQWPPLGFATAPEPKARSDGNKGANALMTRVDDKATGYYFQMQPDGTVRLLPSFAGAPK